MSILKYVEGGYKFCPKCRQVYPVLTMFNKDKSRKDGYYAYCKLCTAEIKRACYKRKKELIKAKTK